MNFLMDRSIANWAHQLSELKAKSGQCNISDTIIATGTLSGKFSWPCAMGDINGTLLLAPTKTVQIQAVSFDFAPQP